jgi:hypothetical protein
MPGPAAVHGRPQYLSSDRTLFSRLPNPIEGT